MKMKVSKTLVKRHANNKTNPQLAETIRVALKNKAWIAIAHKIGVSTKKHISINLSDIDKETKAGDTVIVIGKVLSNGNVTKKVRICALGFSSSALDKLKATKSEAVSILEEIKINPKAEGLKIFS